MAILSAGILVFRRKEGQVEVLIIHPGGPLWAKKDAGSWSLPKGQLGEGEDPLVAALREFEEEIGMPCPTGKKIDLGEIKMKSGKRVRAWAVEGDLDVTQLRSNTFSLEWPPRSGKFQDFPEVDRGAYLSVQEAKEKLIAAQHPFLDRLLEVL